MNERNRNLIVGATTMASIVGLAFLLLIFGYLPRLLQDGYFVTLELSDASSLNVGSRVELSGIDIGQVEMIDFKQPQGSGVVVHLRIREDVRIPTSAEAQIEKPLLGGSPSIRFVTKNTDAVPSDFLANDGSAVVTGSLGAIAGAFGELETLADNIETLSLEWRGVGEKMNQLLETQDLAEVEAGQVPGNLTTAVTRVDRRLSEMRELIAGVDSFVNDPQLREDVSATAANLRGSSEELSRALTSLETRYVALADDVALAVGQMNQMLENANSTQGTIGKLTRDPAVYDNLDSAIKRIGDAADELNLLIQKWKAEGVPIKL